MSSGSFAAHQVRLLAQNGQPHLDVGRLQVGDQAPLKPGNQPLLEVLDLAGRTVARQHDLPVRLVQRVESVEELLLDALFARQELNVIDQQHVGLPVFFSESDQLVVLNAVDVLVRELLRGHIGTCAPFL